MPPFSPTRSGSLRQGIAGALFAAYRNGISPTLHAFAPTRCKHLPTCSEYAYLAVLRHGWFRGSMLAVRRLGRCHPLAEGGYDPVP